MSKRNEIYLAIGPVCEDKASTIVVDYRQPKEFLLVLGIHRLKAFPVNKFPEIYMQDNNESSAI